MLSLTDGTEGLGCGFLPSFLPRRVLPFGGKALYVWATCNARQRSYADNRLR